MQWYRIVVLGSTRVPGGPKRTRDGRPDGDAEGHARGLRARNHRRRGDLRVRHHAPAERARLRRRRRGDGVHHLAATGEERTRPGDETTIRGRARRASSTRSTTPGARNSRSSGRNGSTSHHASTSSRRAGDELLGDHHRQRSHQGMEGVRSPGRGIAGRLPGGVGTDQGSPLPLRGLHRPQPDADPRRRPGAARRNSGGRAEHPRGARRRHPRASARRWPAEKGPGPIATGGASS